MRQALGCLSVEEYRVDAVEDVPISQGVCVMIAPGLRPAV